MRYSTDFNDYELIDASGGEKLERWGEIYLIRPDPQIIWEGERTNPLWKKAHARYHRSDKGGGAWEIFKKHPENWEISYKDLRFKISPTGFKHTGLFPEQSTNWDYLRNLIRRDKREVRVLNLFAYTGGASVACARDGANVTHVDASKGMINWAKENAALSGISSDRIRYLVDDCKKFIEREIRRGNKYDIIVLDPPSYGRGPAGEIWKLEDEITPLLRLIEQLLSENPLAVMLNSYTAGISSGVMDYLMNMVFVKKRGGQVRSDEIGLMVKESGLFLPQGSTSIWEKVGNI